MKSRRRVRRHAQIHLPPLDAGYALTLADIFERAVAALWRAHGDRMAELLTMRMPLAGRPGARPPTSASQTPSTTTSSFEQPNGAR